MIAIVELYRHRQRAGQCLAIGIHRLQRHALPSAVIRGDSCSAIVDHHSSANVVRSRNLTGTQDRRTAARATLVALGSVSTTVPFAVCSCSDVSVTMLLRKSPFASVIVSIAEPQVAAPQLVEVIPPPEGLLFIPELLMLLPPQAVSSARHAEVASTRRPRARKTVTNMVTTPLRVIRPA